MGDGVPPTLRGLNSPFFALAKIKKIAHINPLSANPTKWSNTINKQRHCLSVFDNFVGLALKWLTMTCIVVNYP